MSNPPNEESPDCTHDEGIHRLIAVRAYDLWQRRGGTHGGSIGDWLEAEKDVLAAAGREAPESDRSPAGG